jgi:hypothetical protein
MYDKLTQYLPILKFSKTFVKSYLGSQICFRKISTNYYEEYQTVREKLFYPISAPYETVGMIIKDFKNVENQMLLPYRPKSKRGASSKNTEV